MTALLPLVLVVDDVPETRRLMRRLLERDRFRVIEADTGEDALRAIRGQKPQFVVLDLRLPKLSGFDVARAVRSDPNPEIAGTVLMACSASVHDEIQQQALEAGCDAFEGKPFDVQRFAGRVREVMAQHSRR